jgi:hypothetical protein
MIAELIPMRELPSLPSGHRAEHHEQREAGPEPTEKAETAQQRCAPREDEGDVLA